MNTGNVILLHGICRSSVQMQPLADLLRQNGFTVHNVDYPSTRFDLQRLTEWVWSWHHDCWSSVLPLNMVGFSMGGLLVRALLNRYKPTMMGRVVQLAPPNQGSEVADFLMNFPLYHWLYGPAGQQLGTDQHTIANLLGRPDYPLGILAGNRSIDPFSSLLIAGADDGKVSVERTILPEMTAHKIIPASHTWFPQNSAVMQETLHFLLYGQFRP